jgi:hypothetical protein
VLISELLHAREIKEQNAIFGALLHRFQKLRCMDEPDLFGSGFFLLTVPTGLAMQHQRNSLSKNRQIPGSPMLVTLTRILVDGS